MGKLKKTTLGAIVAAPFDPSGAALVIALGSGTTWIVRSAGRKLIGRSKASDDPETETVGNLVSDLEVST